MNKSDFLEKISSRIVITDECHIWTGHMHLGYSPKFKNVDIRRYIWNLSHNDVVKGERIVTTCQNNSCVKSEHLEKYDSDSPSEILKSINKRIVHEGDCHRWIGTFFEKTGIPKYNSVRVRRHLWNLASKNRLGLKEELETSCGMDTCVNIKHLRVRERPIVWSEEWDRIVKKTDKDGECLLWNGTTSYGYGYTSLKGKSIRVHRLSYMIKTGGDLIPLTRNGQELVIRHLCNKKNCIYPDHLVLGTKVENSADSIECGAQPRGENHKCSSITEKVASEIKLSRLNKGDFGYKTQEERAVIFNVSVRIISSIDNGSTWAHLKDIHGNTSLEKRKIINEKRRRKYILNKNYKLSSDQYHEAGEVLYNRVTKTNLNKIGDISGECWEFKGTRDTHGYGIFSYFGKNKRAHIWSCEIKNKRSRENEECTRHLCGNRICVNPSHLMFGSDKENAQDRLYHKRVKLT